MSAKKTMKFKHAEPVISLAEPVFLGVQLFLYD